MQYPVVSFWDFSLALYREPGIEAACLELQDRCGYDVVVVLGCIFAAATDHEPLSEADMTDVVSSTAAWRDDVIVPLRHLRRTLKSSSYPIDRQYISSLRDRVKTIELEAERRLIEVLGPRFAGGAGTPPTTARICARQNIETYARATGMNWSSTERALATPIIETAFQ